MQYLSQSIYLVHPLWLYSSRLRGRGVFIYLTTASSVGRLFVAHLALMADKSNLNYTPIHLVNN